MKTSELIKKLEQIVAEHGDLDVFGFADEFLELFPYDEKRVIVVDKKLEDDSIDAIPAKYTGFVFTNKKEYEKATNKIVIV